MDFAFHENWPAAQARWEAFWLGETTGRPMMHVTVPAADPPPAPAQPDSLEAFYFDPEYLYQRYRAAIGSRLHLAEAVPSVRGMLAGWLPSYGAELLLAEDTIWTKPLFADWDEEPDWSAWRNDQFEQLAAILDRLGELAVGEYLVGLPPVLPPSDLLSVLRGTDRLMLDLLDCPERVEAALAGITAGFVATLRALGEVVGRRYEGMTHHYEVWAPSLVTLQSDVSCMMSGPQYDRIVAPELRTASAAFGRSIYHLDGPTAIRHLERIAAVPDITMLQWVAGSGQPQSFEHWPQVYGRAQELGLTIYLPIGAGQLEEAIRTFHPRQTYLLVGATDREAALRLIDDAERYTAEYWPGC